MNIIVRACGERTEKKCIELAGKEGKVYVIKTYPFGECLRQSYALGHSFRGQKWIPMIDADVLLLPGQIQRAIHYLEKQNRKIFCLDGKTKDKIFMKVRRAGIHIYKRDLLQQSIKYIQDNNIKPESHVRKQMEQKGYATVSGEIVFGYHDYEQYYCDLWRKSFCQTQKLARMIRTTNIKNKWKKKAQTDSDFRVIMEAHRAGMMHKGKIVIDNRLKYGARKGIERLGLVEKEEI